MSLFEEFESVSSKQWKQQIQFELKGADYSDIVWESPEGIKVKPFYHFDEAHSATSTSPQNQFRICQDIFVHDVEKSVYRAKDSIARGAESIRFTIENPETDIEKLLSGLPFESVSVYLKPDFLSESFLRSVNKIASEKNAKIFCLIDPVGQLARTGNWFRNPAANNFDVIDQLSKTLNSISIISVDGALYQNAGANIIQQVAYALAHANEYLNRVGPAGKTFLFETAVGSNYFFEISKLRALRQLFAVISKEYSADISCHILATPTKRNKTIYDYNVNLLRTTTECMSAILGGADAITNLPYDGLYHKSNEFGERISRNQLLIMKHESYLDKVGNAADGSYYIESLTSQIAEKALVIFKEIEANGGFLKQLGDGTIQRKIRESAEKEQQLFDDGKEVLLGTNKHPNKTDRMAHELELYPFVKIRERKTLITPIIEKRLAEKLEQQRLESEKAEG